MILKGKLKELYWGKGLSQREIAEKIGMSQPGVHKYMKKYGIETRKQDWSKREKDLLVKVYPHLTPKEAGFLFGRSKSSVINKANKMGLKSKRYSNIDKLDKNLLRKLYLEKGLSEAEIAEIFDVTKRAVRLRMRKFGIETRHYTHTKGGEDLSSNEKFYCWLAGLTDGDGSFSIQITRHQGKKGYKEFEIIPRYSICQGEIDTLRGIKREIEYGFVQERSKRGSEYILRSPFKAVKKVTEKIEPFLKIKKDDCEKFLEVCRIKEDGEHLSKQGIIRIAELRDGMNKRQPKPSNYRKAEWFKEYWNK